MQNFVHVFFVEAVIVSILLGVKELVTHFVLNFAVDLFSTERGWRRVEPRRLRSEVIFVFVMAEVELVIQLGSVALGNQVFHTGCVLPHHLEVDVSLDSGRLSRDSLPQNFFKLRPRREKHS